MPLYNVKTPFQDNFTSDNEELPFPMVNSTMASGERKSEFRTPLISPPPAFLLGRKDKKEISVAGVLKKEAKSLDSFKSDDLLDKE
jgi:hypothetical protein